MGITWNTALQHLARRSLGYINKMSLMSNTGSMVTGSVDYHFILTMVKERVLIFFNYHYRNAVHLSNRCRLCLDYYGNYSDISSGDSWLVRLLGRGMNERGLPKGWSSIIVRTTKGLSLIESAHKDGAMYLEEIEPAEIHESFPFNISYKLNGIFIQLK